jgi:hypothetical protein
MSQFLLARLFRHATPSRRPDDPHGVRARLAIERLEDRTNPAPISPVLTNLAAQTNTAILVAQGITQELFAASSLLNAVNQGALSSQALTVGSQASHLLTHLRTLETELTNAEGLATAFDQGNTSDQAALLQEVTQAEGQASGLISQLGPLETQLMSLNSQLAAVGATTLAGQVAAGANQVTSLLAQLQNSSSQLAGVETQLGGANTGSGGAGSAGGTPGSLTLAQAQALVTQLFVDLLGRQPDAAGLGAASNALLQGTSEGALVGGIVNSPEFLGREVQTAFTQILGRGADAGAINAGVSFLQSGQTLEQLEAQLAASDEFFAAAGGTDAGFITLLYQRVLHRDPTQLELNGWLQGRALGGGRLDVAMGIVTSQEANQDVLVTFYTNFLGRIPDPVGLETWTSVFTQNPNELAILTNFLTLGEGEYLNRALANANLPTIPV